MDGETWALIDDLLGVAAAITLGVVVLVAWRQGRLSAGQSAATWAVVCIGVIRITGWFIS